jgi:hypothetical protein
MIQVIQPVAAIATRTVSITGKMRPMRNFSKTVTAGVNTKAKVKANARGMRISRVKYNAAMIANTKTTDPILEGPGFRRDTLIAAPNHRSIALRVAARPCWRGG